MFHLRLRLHDRYLRIQRIILTHLLAQLLVFSYRFIAIPIDNGLVDSELIKGTLGAYQFVICCHKLNTLLWYLAPPLYHINHSSFPDCMSNNSVDVVLLLDGSGSVGDGKNKTRLSPEYCIIVSIFRHLPTPTPVRYPISSTPQHFPIGHPSGSDPICGIPSAGDFAYPIFL